jgi:hypothetical protein
MEACAFRDAIDVSPTLPPADVALCTGVFAQVSLTTSARLNGLDPQAWLADAIALIADHPARRIAQLLPWNWRNSLKRQAA